VRTVRLLILLLVAVLALAAARREATAHAFLLRAEPVPRAVLGHSPTQVVLTFSEPINRALSWITVRGRGRHLGRKLAIKQQGEPDDQLAVTTGRLGPGSYTVAWQSVSALDGHVVRGAYLFSVQSPDPHVTLTAMAAAGTQGTNLDTYALLGVFAHSLLLAATAVALGSLLWARLGFVADATARAQSLTSPRLALMVVLASGVIELVLRTIAASGDSWTLPFPGSALAHSLTDRYGVLWLCRQGIATAILAATFIPGGRRFLLGRRHSAGATKPRGAATLSGVALAAAYLLLLGASGEGGGVPARLTGIALSTSLATAGGWLLLVGTMAWASVLAAWLPARRRTQPATTTGGDAAGTNRRGAAALLTAGAVVALLAELWDGAVNLNSWNALGAIYGVSLLSAAVLTAVIALLGARWLRSGRAPRSRSPSAESTGTQQPSRLEARESAPRRTAVAVGLLALLALSSMYWFPMPAGLSAGDPAALGAGSWRQLGLPGVTVHFLAAGHHTPGLIFAATETGVYRHQAIGAWQRVLPSRSVWGIELLPDDHSLYAADLAGYVESSRDRGAHWRSILVSSGGMYAVTSQPGRSSRVLAGGAGGLFLSTDSGVRWRRTLALPGSAGTAFAWRPGSDRVVFAGAVAGTETGSTQVWISRDAGTTWRLFGRGLESFSGIMSLLAPDPATIYAGTMGHAVWRAFIGAGSWRSSSAGMPPTEDHVAAFASLPGHPNVLFAGTLGQGVFRSSDAGARWRPSSDGLPSVLGNQIVLSLCFAPRDSLLLAGTEDGVYAEAEQA